MYSPLLASEKPSELLIPSSAFVSGMTAVTPVRSDKGLFFSPLWDEITNFILTDLSLLLKKAPL